MGILTVRDRKKGAVGSRSRDIGIADGFSSKMGKLFRVHRRVLCGLTIASILVLALVASGVAAPALDPGFGDGGVAEVPMPENEREAIASELGQGPLVWDLSVGKGGDLVAAIGSGTVNGYFGAVSYRPDGAIDRHFSGDGFVQAGKIFPRLGSVSQAQGVAVEDDGKVVLVGYRTEGAADAPAPVLIRLRSDGRPDRRFGQRGLVAPRLSDGARADALHAVAVGSGGRIIAVGGRNERYRGVPPKPRPAALVVAYQPNGHLDRGFGNRGRVLLFGAKRYAATLFDISILGSGKIVVAGYRNGRLFVARLKKNGALDRGFGGGDGEVPIDFEEHVCCGLAASLFAFDRGGSLVLSDGFRSVLMARLQPDGQLDPRFGNGGIVRQTNERASLEMRDVAVQRDGRIVAVGGDIKQGRLVFAIRRFRADGRLDRRFGKRGTTWLPTGRASFGTSAVTLPNGRVVVGGGAQYRRGERLEYSLLLARLHG